MWYSTQRAVCVKWAHDEAAFLCKTNFSIEFNLFAKICALLNCISATSFINFDLLNISFRRKEVRHLIFARDWDGFEMVCLVLRR